MSNLDRLRRRAHSGDSMALLELVHRLLASRQADQCEEAMQVLMAAGDRGDVEALRLHATLALRGIGRPQNFDEAIALVSRAAALGDAKAAGQLRVLGGKFDRAVWFAPMQLRQHHAAPRVFTVENFIPRAVCDWFIAFAHGRLERSTVRDGVTGLDIVQAGRSATFAGANLLEGDLVLQFTNLRIAGALQTHVAQQEPTQFLHYGPGQEYQAHYDLIRPQEEAAAAEELRILGQRIATVLVYLNEGYDGGETHFPHLNWAFKGKAGDALIFWNVSATGEREFNSLHAGAPVKSGEKWLLSKWVRAKAVPLI